MFSDPDWRYEMEKRLREQIVECMTNGRRCLYKSSFKRKLDLQPICERIKADFESVCMSGTNVDL